MQDTTREVKMTSSEMSSNGPFQTDVQVLDD